MPCVWANRRSQLPHVCTPPCFPARPAVRGAIDAQQLPRVLRVPLRLGARALPSPSSRQLPFACFSPRKQPRVAPPRQRRSERQRRATAAASAATAPPPRRLSAFPAPRRPRPSPPASAAERLACPPPLTRATALSLPSGDRCAPSASCAAAIRSTSTASSSSSSTSSTPAPCAASRCVASPALASQGRRNAPLLTLAHLRGPSPSPLLPLSPPRMHARPPRCAKTLTLPPYTPSTPDPRLCPPPRVPACDPPPATHPQMCDMTQAWRIRDHEVENTPMPEEYRDRVRGNPGVDAHGGRGRESRAGCARPGRTGCGWFWLPSEEKEACGLRCAAPPRRLVSRRRLKEGGRADAPLPLTPTDGDDPVQRLRAVERDAVPRDGARAPP